MIVTGRIFRDASSVLLSLQHCWLQEQASLVASGPITSRWPALGVLVNGASFLVLGRSTLLCMQGFSSFALVCSPVV